MGVPMKKVYILFNICLLFLYNCNDYLESWSTKSQTIPFPNSETITYTGRDHTLQLSYADYTHSYRLTTYPAYEIDWSPNKEWLCFLNDFNIYKIRYNGDELQIITPTTMECELPRFSPDGSRIVFCVNRDERPHYFSADIAIINSDGTGYEKIIENTMFSNNDEYQLVYPDWLRDGEKIIFKFNKIVDNLILFQNHLAIFDLSTEQMIVLSELDTLMPFFPRPSPTRDEFLFVSLLSRELGGTDIYRANLDGTGITRLTFNGCSWFPDWSADGEHIIYNYNRSSDGRNIRTIRVMDRNGANDRQVMIPGEYGGVPNW